MGILGGRLDSPNAEEGKSSKEKEKGCWIPLDICQYTMWCAGFSGRRFNMNPKLILPIVLITLDVGAALVYAYYRDYRMAVYWLSAAVLTTTVTME